MMGVAGEVKMKQLSELLQPFTIRKADHRAPESFGEQVIEQQRKAREEFLRMVAERMHTALRLWRPGDPLPAEGRRILVGVAPWSEADMQLMDALTEAVASGITGSDQIDVFDFPSACQTQEQLDQFIPGVDLRSIFHTPVVGV